MRSRTNKPVIPYIQIYDRTGAQAFTNVGQFHTWDTIDFKTNDLHYTVDDDRILINIPGTGYYEITFECSFLTYVNGLSQIVSQAYKNGVAVIGAKAIACASAAAQTPTSCGCQTLHFVMYLEARDYIQIKTTSTNQSYSGGETSRLIMKFIPTLGWNNNSGGNTNYRGRVMR
jgi:hypothetical protein